MNHAALGGDQCGEQRGPDLKRCSFEDRDKANKNDQQLPHVGNDINDAYSAHSSDDCEVTDYGCHGRMFMTPLKYNQARMTTS